MKGMKKVLKVDELKKLNVPTMKETEVKVLYPTLMSKIPELKEYIPDYPEKTFPD